MPNSNQRGNSYSRRARKLFLLNKFGNGIKAPCWECGAMVDYDTIVADRIKPAREGGTYVRTNIRVHCHDCSNREGARITNEIRAATAEQRWDAEQWAATERLRV
jgi:5-methylcytosine-specific restriction endonuclease McrA